MSTTATKAREVKLPICPKCDRVGKSADGQFKGYCVGPAGASHKKVKTSPRLFREVVS